MRPDCSFQLAQGHSRPKWSDVPGKTLRRLCWVYCFGTVRFELGYIGKSARIRITRSFFFGLRQSTWEILGPANSMHQLPNGAKIVIGVSRTEEHSDVPFTTIFMQEASFVQLRAIPALATA